jgi:hypothetical protein
MDLSGLWCRYCFLHGLVVYSLFTLADTIVNAQESSKYMFEQNLKVCYFRTPDGLSMSAARWNGKVVFEIGCVNSEPSRGESLPESTLIRSGVAISIRLNPGIASVDD